MILGGGLLAQPFSAYDIRVRAIHLCGPARRTRALNTWEYSYCYDIDLLSLISLLRSYPGLKDRSYASIPDGTVGYSIRYYISIYGS